MITAVAGAGWATGATRRPGPGAPSCSSRPGRSRPVKSGGCSRHPRVGPARPATLGVPARRRRAGRRIRVRPERLRRRGPVVRGARDRLLTPAARCRSWSAPSCTTSWSVIPGSGRTAARAIRQPRRPAPARSPSVGWAPGQERPSTSGGGGSTPDRAASARRPGGRARSWSGQWSPSTPSGACTRAPATTGRTWPSPLRTHHDRRHRHQRRARQDGLPAGGPVGPRRLGPGPRTRACDGRRRRPRRRRRRRGARVGRPGALLAARAVEAAVRSAVTSAVTGT